MYRSFEKVAKREKIGPIPEPGIVNSAAWFPRANTWEQESYDGGYGPVGYAIDIEPEIGSPEEERAKSRWAESYLLKWIEPEAGAFYMNRLEDEGILYPEDLQVLVSEKAVPSNVYWRRDLRPEKIFLAPFIHNLNRVDLYLMPTNLFEHRPARKLLSYFSDSELHKLMHSNNLLGETRRERIERIEAGVLYRYGWLELVRVERPIAVRKMPENITLDMEQLLSMTQVTRIQLLRLYIELVASHPWLTDAEVWNPLLDLVEDQMHLFFNDYIQLKMQDNDKEHTNQCITFPEKLCLTCERIRPDEDFALCSHPMCKVCQESTGEYGCPYCNEQFVSDSVDSRYVRNVERNRLKRNPVKRRIEEISNTARERIFMFDWTNRHIQVFGIK